jgi:hypothetical protein
MRQTLECWPDFRACPVDTLETPHKSLSDAERFPRNQREEKVQIGAVCEGSKTIAQLRPKFLKRCYPPKRQGWRTADDAIQDLSIMSSVNCSFTTLSGQSSALLHFLRAPQCLKPLSSPVTRPLCGVQVPAYHSYRKSRRQVRLVEAAGIRSPGFRS